MLVFSEAIFFNPADFALFLVASTTSVTYVPAQAVLTNSTTVTLTPGTVATPVALTAASKYLVTARPRDLAGNLIAAPAEVLFATA